MLSLKSRDRVALAAMLSVIVAVPAAACASGADVSARESVYVYSKKPALNDDAFNASGAGMPASEVLAHWALPYGRCVSTTREPRRGITTTATRGATTRISR
jgi:hypothetical protein